MPITYDSSTQCFHLSNDRVSYIFRLAGGKYPIHVHWGRHVRRVRDDAPGDAPRLGADLQNRLSRGKLPDTPQHLLVRSRVAPRPADEIHEKSPSFAALRAPGGVFIR